MDGRVLGTSLQMEQNNTFSLDNPTQKEMKKNPVWWQIVTLLAGIVVPFTIFLVGLTKTQSAQEERLKSLESKTYDYQKQVEKEFDKTGVKLDKIDDTMTKILVELQNKQDRK